MFEIFSIIAETDDGLFWIFWFPVIVGIIISINN